ncbi:MAG: hypothetical protein IIV41_07950 [Akkermansia sp.]|nr:hypothetical protein [Akkermansia sp.]
MGARIPLLINPKAGSLFRSGFKKWLKNHRDEFRLVPTRSAADLTEKAAKLAAKGEAVVAAAGGDGTLMGAAAGLIGTGTALGIVPCGTMNVFARELGIGSRRFDRALAAMKGDETQEVDIFTVNGKPFLQMAGFGPDARVIELITPLLKKRMGAAAHVVTGIKVALEAPPMITMTLPDGEQLRGTQIIMGNGKRYGGEAHLFAEAAFDDGRLDTAIINQENIAVLFEVLGLMVSRGATQHNISDFTTLRSIKSCTITAEAPLPYQLDGDYAGSLQPGEELRIERLAHKLKVKIPAAGEEINPFDRLLAHPLLNTLRGKINLVL